ncbi:MAG: nickel pincer cofactor biosynthesis protein LarB [Candidatus Aminicenantes bacterium]|nr:nickel pincer cofactor biosynthesis protein LarB [Candidatus Aminicenantes bacterium]
MTSRLEDILDRVARGRLTPAAALGELRDYPYCDLDFAKVDHHRELRKGFPEIIFGLGKTPDQIARIAREIVRKGSNLLATRIEPDVYRRIRAKLPRKTAYNPAARTLSLKQKTAVTGKGRIAIVTAGTSDIPVAEEAFVTCDILGNDVVRVYDVGVAGIHRLLGEMDKIRRARVVITVAGMEGALPSVVAGLVSVPVIAVPTSIGYGASFKGLAALLAMLNACPGGVAVVNIDNGFGAAYLASLINHL